MERKLTARAGMVYTNGETWGREIYLSDIDSPDNWTEVAESEMEEEQADEHH